MPATHSALAFILSVSVVPPIAANIVPVDTVAVMQKQVVVPPAHFVANSANETKMLQATTNLPTHTALARLRSFKNWAANWDGESAPAPQAEVLESAITLLGHLSAHHFVPRVGLNSFGQPHFLFSSREYEGEIIVESKNRLSYFIRGGIDDTSGDARFTGAALPRRLEDALRNSAFIA